MRDDKLREQTKTIRQLKGHVRQLRKQLQLAESELELLRELWEQDIIDMAKGMRRTKIKEKKEPLCPQCGNPGITLSKIGIWNLSRCDICDYFNRQRDDENDH